MCYNSPNLSFSLGQVLPAKRLTWNALSQIERRHRHLKKRKSRGTSLLALFTVLAFILPALATDLTLSNRLQNSGGGSASRTAAVMLLPQDSGEHIQYMTGSDGLFCPEQPVTRAELAQMLSRIVAEAPHSTPSFYDVPWNAWYAPAVQKAAGLGLMTSSGGAFRPNDPATRAECAAALSPVVPYDVTVTQSFPDVGSDHWAWYAISRTASYGLFRGDDMGYFHPNDSLKRCEVVAVFNRLLGRSPDTAYLAQHSELSVFPDVSTDHWAYADIMEAAVTHQCAPHLTPEVWVSTGDAPIPAEPQPSAPTEPTATTLTDGPQRINGRLYWVANGQFMRNQNVGGLYFDENGCYTTKNAELDVLLNDIVNKLTDNSMSQDQKLRALFNYTVNNYKYLARPIVSKGATGWEPDYALSFLKTGKGNCFSFAAAYCLMCQELGLPAYTVVGASGEAGSPHGWVEIVMDGTLYMFDPELQWYYNNKTSQKVDLFKMQPSQVPSNVYRYIW